METFTIAELDLLYHAIRAEYKANPTSPDKETYESTIRKINAITAKMLSNE